MNDMQLFVLGTACFLFTLLLVILHRSIFYKDFKFKIVDSDGGLLALLGFCMIPLCIILSINWALIPTYLLLWAYYKHEYLFNKVKPALRKFLENVLND